jgi:hypothetical protein
MAKLQRDLSEFIGLLNSTRVEFVVVGGHAVAFHGHPRFTGDIDLLLRPRGMDHASFRQTRRSSGRFSGLGCADSEQDRFESRQGQARREEVAGYCGQEEVRPTVRYAWVPAETVPREQYQGFLRVRFGAWLRLPMSGSPGRAMTTSSPRSTFASSFEKLVLA